MNSTEFKINRLKSGKRPRVLDLFAGCGGISVGFQQSGFEVIGAIEIDPTAAQTHALNFFQGSEESLYAFHSQPHDITKLEPEDYIKQIGFPDFERAVDVIVGGPPCQAFARVGRAKLREVAEHPEAFLNDPRSNLYLRYLHYVRKLKPVALLMENVPDVLNFGGHNIAEEVCESLEDLGYECRYTLLNSVYFGVPQMRERMFLIAVHRDLGQKITFPTPTHWIELPKGYHGTRQVALKHIQNDLFSESFHYVKPPVGNPEQLKPAVTAEDATRDLAPITIHLEGDFKKGARKFDTFSGYRQDIKPTKYAEIMRNWPGFEGKDGIHDHVIRSLPRDYALFARMNPGDQYPEAYNHAMDLLREKAAKKRIKEGSAEFEALKKEIVPPYDPGKFPNKWRKMEADKPSRTLMAHLGKDSYSHIHYDSKQARTISVREAARLQSFPDGFIFCGAMNAAFRQIGNAVPPLMAKAIGDKIMDTLKLLTHAKETRYQESDSF